MLSEINRRLVLRYDPGQFTFRNFRHTASDAQLFELAQGLNAFQECELEKVLRIQTFEMS